VGKRRKAREIVLQALYETEFSDRSREEVLENQAERRSSTEETVEYAHDLLGKTLDHLPDLDGKIENALEHWAIDRLSLVDRNILRFALAEILYSPQIPSKVIINEAIEIAQKYSSLDAGKLINGLLDRFVKEYREDPS
jgi:N utilization substance protein B